MNLSKQNIITLWLLSGLSLVLLMIIIGGITRITESGLSIAHWSLSGDLPTKENMINAYLEWKQTPQGKLLESMDINKFRHIYIWEYIHRMTGRLLGVLFILPFIFFSIKKWIKRADIKKYIYLLILGFLQALIGWWMVRSGLIENPRVSHIRLAIHFIAALILAAYILWMILDKNYNKIGIPKIHNLSKGFLLLLFLQLIYGAFTAGLRAGHLVDAKYPIMTIIGYFHPEGMRNLDIINNPYNVQFIHRTLAWIIVWYALYIWKKTRKTQISTIGNIFLITIILQITLGVLTILLNMQKEIALMHQFIAAILVLVTISILFLSDSNEKR